LNHAAVDETPRAIDRPTNGVVKRRRHATGRPVSLLGNCETARLRYDGERFIDE
jgi:hypothetical protein